MAIAAFGYGVLVGLLLMASQSCAATDQLDRIKSDINSVEAKMQRISQQRDAMQNLLTEVEQRYAETAAVLRKLQMEVDGKRASLEKIPAQIEGLENGIAQCHKELSEQVRAAYAIGQQPRLKLLMNQKDPVSSSRIMVYYDYFNKSRLTKLAFVATSVKKLDLLSAQKQKDTALLEQTLAKTKAEQAKLNNVRKERNALLLQLNSDFSSNEQRLERLRKSEQDLIELVDALDAEEDNPVLQADSDTVVVEDDETIVLDEGDKAILSEVEQSSVEPEAAEEASAKVAANFAKLKGKLPLPVLGQLVGRFGEQKASGVGNGVLIAADEGQDVKAVSDGRVLFAKDFQSYGQLMIVDHGDDFMTLYAFNQSLYKKKGDWVQAGEVIAAVGQSGGRSQPALYFEIRKQGKPVDPLLWAAK
jgi:murein hydrolase activator